MGNDMVSEKKTDLVVLLTSVSKQPCLFPLCVMVTYSNDYSCVVLTSLNHHMFFSRRTKLKASTLLSLQLTRSLLEDELKPALSLSM